MGAEQKGPAAVGAADTARTSNTRGKSYSPGWPLCQRSAAGRDGPTLFDDFKRSVGPADPRRSPEARARLGRNAARLLERLERGAATNMELTTIGGLRFGGRLHELRRAGYRIETRLLDAATGLYSYELLGKPDGGVLAAEASALLRSPN